MIPSKWGDCLQISYKFVCLQRGARGATWRGVCNPRAPAWARSRDGAWASSCGAETGACQRAWGSHWGKDPEISPFTHTCWHDTRHARGQPGKTPSFITVCWVSLVSINLHLWRCAVITNRISEISCKVKCVLFQPSSWASVTSKNLPPGGVVPATGVPPHVVRVPSAQVDVHNQRLSLLRNAIRLAISCCFVYYIRCNLFCQFKTSCVT